MFTIPLLVRLTLRGPCCVAIAVPIANAMPQCCNHVEGPVSVWRTSLADL